MIFSKKNFILFKKTTHQNNLENKKFIFSEIGLIIALSFTLLAFEWKSYENFELDFSGQLVLAIDEDVIINTQQDKPSLPPPQLQTTILNIVEDNVDVDNDLIIDVETDQYTKMKKYIPFEEEEKNIVETKIFISVQEYPSFPGGDEARINFLQNNIKFPKIGKEIGLDGIVYVTFVVEKNGSVSNVKILRGIGGGYDEEAIRITKDMPKWNPGKQRENPVRVQLNMPIKFTLE